MPRYSNGMQISQLYIVDGFADDCDELLHRCSKASPLTYFYFAEIWKDMKFYSIYKHRGTHAEIGEMSEEFLQIAKRYMVANRSNYEENIAGLFLVYALLNLQPYSGFASVRITPEDLPAISRIETVARRERRFDVLRVLGSVLIEGPCVYSFVDRPRGLEMTFKKYFNGYAGLDNHGMRPKGVFYRQNTELDLIRDMITFSRRYSEAKSEINGTATADKCLTYTDEKLPQELETSLKRVISGVYTMEDSPQKSQEDDNPTDDSALERSNLIQSIKEKAMKGTVGRVKHLTGIVEQKKTAKGRRKKSSKIKKGGGKVKNSSPNKPLISGSPRKRKRSNTTSPKKKRTKKISDDSDSDDIEGLPMSYYDDVDPITDDEEYIPSKQSISKRIHENSEDNTKKSVNSEVLNNIDIESLPVVMTTGNDNQYIEIEIIDECYKNNDEGDSGNVTGTQSNTSKCSSFQKNRECDNVIGIDSNTATSQNSKINIDATKTQKPANISSNKAQNKEKDDAEDIVNKIRGLPNLSVKKVSTDAPNICGISYFPNNDDDLFKKPQDVKMRVEKRDQKKTAIKSKFKKMGMLRVANINE